MKISIVIPLYNVEKYIKECLHSILEQSNCANIQAIIIDDGSQDDSALFALEYVKKYPTIFEYYKKENGGLSDARNFGVNFAKGDYLMFLDSDDYLKKDACQIIANIIDSTNADLILFNYIQFDENNQGIVMMIDEPCGFINKKQYLLCPPTAWNKVIKTKMYKENHVLFPEGLWYEDRATTGSYVNYVESIYYVNEPLYYYRQRISSIMNQKQYSPKMMDMKKAITYTLNGVDKKVYYEELEYICISNLIAQSGELLLGYGRQDELNDFIDYIDSEFPNWKSNVYLKKRSLSYRSICKAIGNRNYRMAKFMIAVKHRLFHT